MTLAPVTEMFPWLHKLSLPVGGAIAGANLIQEKHPEIQSKCNPLLEWTGLTPQVSRLMGSKSIKSIIYYTLYKIFQWHGKQSIVV